MKFDSMDWAPRVPFVPRPSVLKRLLCLFSRHKYDDTPHWHMRSHEHGGQLLIYPCVRCPHWKVKGL